ncbi:MAG: PaaI family thioesterase [Bacteroidetes bacterium]|nr:PaaI family thioesterase [Bacteroidota bacterium]
MMKNIFNSITASIEELNAFCNNTMSDFLGIRITEIAPDFVKAEMPVNEKTMHPFKMMHGGASFVLAEHVGSVASNLVMDRNSFFAFGQNLTGSHIKPAKKGEKVFGYAYALHIGSTSHVWEIKIRNTQGDLLFSGQLTMAIRPIKNNG